MGKVSILFALLAPEISSKPSSRHGNLVRLEPRPFIGEAEHPQVFKRNVHLKRRSFGSCTIFKTSFTNPTQTNPKHISNHHVCHWLFGASSRNKGPFLSECLLSRWNCDPLRGTPKAIGVLVHSLKHVWTTQVWQKARFEWWKWYETTSELLTYKSHSWQSCWYHEAVGPIVFWQFLYMLLPLANLIALTWIVLTQQLTCELKAPTR